MIVDPHNKLQMDFMTVKAPPAPYNSAAATPTVGQMAPTVPAVAPVLPAEGDANANVAAATAAAALQTDLPPIPDGGPHPHLRRQLVLMHRGRLLREEFIEGQPRYIDDAAIFVSRLVRDSETIHTLHRRFAAYGAIVTVELNRWTEGSTYSTARVLFQDARAAQGAMTMEVGFIVLV